MASSNSIILCAREEDIDKITVAKKTSKASILLHFFAKLYTPQFHTITMSNMQQRRPHSTVSIPNGNSNATTDELGSSSSAREQRRLERRMAKERRTQLSATSGGGVKKLKRVKRRIDKYSRKNKSSLSLVLNNPLYQAAFVSFSLFALFGMTVYKMFHGSSSSDDGGG